MSVLVTPDEMRAAEAAAIAAGVSEPELMRRAATEIADWIDTRVQRRANARRFAIALVGPGNNGGDALVALALLAERGWRVGAMLLGRAEYGTLPVSDELLEQIERVGPEAFSEAEVVLDGVYGIGSRASLGVDIADAFAQARAARIERGTALVAIDVPSGVDAGAGAADDDAFEADVTLCLGLPKIGLTLEPAATHTGELVVLPIGVELADAGDRPVIIDDVTVRRLLPRRRATAHKHQTGTVLVLGGAPTYYGAPRLTGEAALRAGAGLVCVAAPASIIPVIASQVPELVLLPLDESPERALSQLVEWIEARGEHLDVIVAGPGLSQSEFASRLLDGLFHDDVSPLADHPSVGLPRPTFVIDADALNWIATRGEFPRHIHRDRAVLTPHAGELARLLGISRDAVLEDPHASVRQAAESFGQVVILKSGYSAIASPAGGLYIAPRATPELATAGTGDVLAGLVGGLLAQGLSPIDAARTAIYLGSMSGRHARQLKGLHGVLARDVIDAIPATLNALTGSTVAIDMM